MSNRHRLRRASRNTTKHKRAHPLPMWMHRPLARIHRETRSQIHCCGRICCPITRQYSKQTRHVSLTILWQHQTDILPVHGHQAAEHIATQPTMNEHGRSIDLRHHSIRQHYVEDGMRIEGVSSKDNTSDILTKFLQPDLHHIHTNQLHPPRPVPIPYNRQTPPTLIPPVDPNTSSSHDDTKPSKQTHLHNLVTRLSHLNLNGRLPGNVKDTHITPPHRYLTQSQQMT
jgi:hypothetical protein